MTKRVIITVMAGMLATASFSQSAKSNLEQAKNNPVTTQNAAKADVQQVDRKNVVDGATLRNAVARKRQERMRRQRGLHRRSSQ